MNRERINFLLQEAGCEKINFQPRSRSPYVQIQALERTGLSEVQQNLLASKRKKLKFTNGYAAPALAVLGTVTFGYQVYKYSKDFDAVSKIVEHWEDIQMAFAFCSTVGFGNTGYLVAEIVKNWHTIEYLAEAKGVVGDLASATVEAGVDIAEAGYTLLLGTALSATAWGLFKWINYKREQRLKNLKGKAEPVIRLRLMLERGATPYQVREQLKLVPAQLV